MKNKCDNMGMQNVNMWYHDTTRDTIWALETPGVLNVNYNILEPEET
jgi:hypothetical protein